MKQLTVRFLATANADVKAIFDWIADSSSNRDVAAKFIGRIFDRCDGLSDFPEQGIARSDLSPGLRLLPFERKAAIFYRITRDEVQITKVLYRGRDYDETTFE